MMKNITTAQKGDIEKSKSKTDDNESKEVSKVSKKPFAHSVNDNNNSSISELAGSRKKLGRKERIQKKIEDIPEKVSFESKSDLVIDSRRSSTNSDLSIAIAMSTGRGKRAAASKALEKTKDMYHNLPPLVEEVIVPSNSKKVKKLTEESVGADNGDPLVAYNNEKSSSIKVEKKKAVAVKMESDITAGNIKAEENKSSEFKGKITKNYKIAFTGGQKDDRKPLETMIRKFGGSVVESWSDCTHLVTDKIRRTSKFLCALATGKFIMNPNWLEACKKNGSFVGKHL
jgi:hypothetical protein